MADTIRPVSAIHVALFNRYFFLACHLRSLISSRKNASISVNFLINMFVVLKVPLGLDLDNFFFIVVYTHCLFNS